MILDKILIHYYNDDNILKRVIMMKIVLILKILFSDQKYQIFKFLLLLSFNNFYIF